MSTDAAASVSTAQESTARGVAGANQPAGALRVVESGGAPLRVAVFGAAGRLGQVVAAALAADPRTDLVARLGRDTPRAVLTESGAQVAVDVTVPGAVLANVGACLDAGLHVVVGTSGLGSAELAVLEAQLAGHAGLGVLVAPNFALGSVLATRLAATAARFLASVEIVELHHDRKVDAPSGTARRTAQVVADARADAGLGLVPDATAADPDGARGALVDGIRVHAVRLPGLVAHQQVLFGGTGEVLTIRHDSTSRDSFAAGAVLAALAVPSRPGLTVGLEHVLGLA